MGKSDSAVLIRSLQDTSVFDHDVSRFKVIETHISWVLLTGPYAYKIKKPVDFGFVDFTTLEKRRFYCYEELRLNPRLAPGIYLDVVPITGSVEKPLLNGSGDVIEYAVKMVEFPQEALLHHALERGEVSDEIIDTLTMDIAHFHKMAKLADEESPFGTPWNIHQPQKNNFEQIVSLAHPDEDLLEKLDNLSSWSRRENLLLFDTFLGRKNNGFIRECHGDMHTGNMALLDDEIAVFDGIEFNESLHWIDVINDIAFFIMDLEDRGYTELSHRVMNLYLEASEDYEGLSIMQYYLLYRAMVRAKVACLSMCGDAVDYPEREKLRASFDRYIDLAEYYTLKKSPMLIITHGVTGSGKTTLTQSLLEAIGAVRVRSDVTRKSLFGLTPMESSGSGLRQDIYTHDATRRTYARLEENAEIIIKAGYSAIVDATCISRINRDSFRDLADKLNVPFAILDFVAPISLLKKRVENRLAKRNDASEADVMVMNNQFALDEPLGPDELVRSVTLDCSKQLHVNNIVASLEIISNAPIHMAV